jgi:signal transduction histidine kinase
MPDIPPRRFLSTIQAPAAEALDLLSAHSPAIFAEWEREVRELGLEPDDFLGGYPPNLTRFADLLRESTYPVFRQQLQSLGGRLAKRGVKLGHSVAATNRLFEICLSYLKREVPKRATPLLALARLHALASLLITSGYTGQWAGGEKTLVEASLSEAEDRRHGASVYVTKVYEQERTRLSRDLHDEVGHDLILIKLYLEMIAMEAQKRNLQGVQPRLREAISLVSHALDSVRRLVLDLGPAVFDELGFLPAVRSCTQQFSARTKINVTFREGYLPAEIPMSHQVALYRVLQGALSNVLKHASAKNVKVSIGSMKGSVLIMVIEDDGVGFASEAKKGRPSFGLTAMGERVEVLGGRIHIQSRPASAHGKSHGTRIEVDLPLPGGAK